MTDDRRPPMMGSPPIPFSPQRPRHPNIIDESAEITRELERGLEHQQMPGSIVYTKNPSEIQPPPPPQLSYRSCVAESINECRYLDVKGIAKEIMGDPIKPIETPADLADRMAEWAAENKTKTGP